MRPNDIPGHILLPAPNGIYSKFPPLNSIELSINLSGIKFSGSIQYFGSLPIAQRFTINLVFLGTKAPGGCNLKVSLTTDFNSLNPFIKKTKKRKKLTNFKGSKVFESFLRNQYELFMITAFLAKRSPRYDVISQSFKLFGPSNPISFDDDDDEAISSTRVNNSSSLMGLDAKTTSWVLMTSSAYSADETTIVGTCPISRNQGKASRQFLPRIRSKCYSLVIEPCKPCALTLS
ncbi:hypothetical protein F8388_008126 [Cannabis sativa]|uniref:Uncharacterized protein n=1 Tax=Cannabis sativa TaxID=3483 RepID=A0A7J6EUY1_CANSA|nr:hypothetical protein F8388_008126 [Cannabis sativa]